jgi:hypothetical protein
MEAVRDEGEGKQVWVRRHGVGVDGGRDGRTNTETGARRRHSGGADAGQNGHAVVTSE